MEIRRSTKNISYGDGLRNAGIVLCLLAGACVLGFAIISAGATSTTQTFAIGGIFIALLAGAIAFILEIPMIGLVRYAFIGSFFFKGDLNLFKINEVEDPSGLNISLTLIMGVVLFVYELNNGKSREHVFPPVFKFFVTALLVCAAASVLTNGATMLGGFSLFSFVSTIFIAYVTALHFSRRDRLVQLVIGIAGGLFFTGLVSASQYFADFPTNLANLGTGTEDELLGTQSQLLSRVPAFMRTPTEMAWVVSSLIPLTLAPLLCRVKEITPTQKILLAAGVLAGTVAVILSLARGSWIGLVIGIMLLVAFGWYKLAASERKSYFISVFFGLCLAAVLLAPFATRIYDRLTEDDQGSALIRVPLMETALRMIDDNPLAGVGMNGYRTNMTRYDETGMFVSQVFPNPVHNIFAHITAEIGVPGGIFFCLLILYAIYECFKVMGSNDRLLTALALGLGICLIVFVISGTKEPGSLGSVRPPIRTCFLLIGTILGLGIVHRRTLSNGY